MKRKNVRVDKHVTNTVPYLLNDFPEDILKSAMGEFLQDSDKKNLAEMGNKNLFFYFCENIKPANQRQLICAQHVIKGEKAQAEIMIREDHGLLQHKALVTNHAGQQVYGTLLQIALGACDVSINDTHEEMAEMIKRYIRMTPNGEDKIIEQQKEQFPNGYKKAENAKTEKDLIALRKVTLAIGKSKTNEECENAIAEFQAHLKPKEILKTGKHFNNQLLVEVHKLYDKNYSGFGGNDSRKNRLYSSKVLGLIEFYMPAFLGMAFCDGLYNSAIQKQQVKRDLLLADGTHFYPAHLNAESGIGINRAAFSFAGLEMVDCIHLTDYRVKICGAGGDAVISLLHQIDKALDKHLTLSVTRKNAKRM